MASEKYVLFHSDGAGSTFSLVLLRLFNCPHEVVELDYKSVVQREDTPDLRRLLEANPLAQFPTLITPEGVVMTETAAIALYLNDRHGAGSPWCTSSLEPPQLAAFYRWLVYLPANIYPTVTVIEFPEQFVSVPADAAASKEDAAKWVAKGTSERRKDVWLLLEKNIGVKGYTWFNENCPKLTKIVTETMKAVEEVWSIFDENGLDAFMGKEHHAAKLNDTP